MRDPEHSVLRELTSELLAEKPTGSIPVQKVRGWMRETDMEVIGAVFNLLHKKQCYSRIDPALTFEDYHRFHLMYYDRCIRENPSGTWCDSRYLAAHSLVNWFNGLWNDPSAPRRALVDLKMLLSRLYREGDDEQRTAVVTGALEHLFTDPEIRNFFEDWRGDPVLKQGFGEANGFNK